MVSRAGRKTDAGFGKQSSRDALLQAVKNLMTRGGTIDVSLSDIAQESGLNSALIKYYFGTKQGMMIALVEDVVLADIAQLHHLLESDANPVEKLRSQIGAIVNVYFRNPYLNRLVNKLFEDPESAEILAERVSRPMAAVQRALIEQGVEQGYFRNVDPMLLYFMVLGACDHLFFGQRMLKVTFGLDIMDEQLRKSYANTILDLVMNGILLPKPAA